MEGKSDQRQQESEVTTRNGMRGGEAQGEGDMFIHVSVKRLGISNPSVAGVENTSMHADARPM